MSSSFHDRCLGFIDRVPDHLRRSFPDPFQEKGLDFTSNDTLALSKHPALRAGALDAMDRYGMGSTGSRLLSGNHPLHLEVETQLATLKKQSQLWFLGGVSHQRQHFNDTCDIAPLG
jgi:7-keto-8-aminopelargonate synthetase-like enzyme